MLGQAVRGFCWPCARPVATAPSLAQQRRNPGMNLRSEVQVVQAVKAVIFDMDGVLTASEGLSRLAAATVFKQLHQLEVQPDEFIPFGGMGEDRFLGGIAQKYGVQRYDAAAAKHCFFTTYIDIVSGRSMSIAYPGAVDVVRSCRTAGLSTAVGSSAEQIKVDINLAAAGFKTSDFNAIVAADKFEAIKPAPDIFLCAAELIGVEPAECIVVEDAPSGIQAAKAAGMPVIAVSTTLTSEELQHHQPDLIRSDISRVSLADITSLVQADAISGKG